MEAMIDPCQNWKMHIMCVSELGNLDEFLKKKLKGKRKKFAKYFAGKDNVGNDLHFVVQHEIGHHRFCPFDHFKYGEEIISGISEGLEERNWGRPEIEQYANRIKNEFADILDNVMNMYRDKTGKYEDGFLVDYVKEGLKGSEEEGFNDEFCIFIDTIAKLGMDNSKMKDFASHFNDKYRALELDVREVVQIFTSDSALTEKVMDGKTLALEDKLKIYRNMNNRARWHQMAKEYAKIIGPHLRDQGKPKNKLTNSSSPTDTEQGIRQMIRHSIKNGHSTSYADEFTVLDEMHKMEAEDINMRMNKHDGDEMKLPIAYMARKEIGPRPDLSCVDWTNPDLEIGPNGPRMQFYEHHAPIFADEDGFLGEGRIPNILLIIDKSGSMTSCYRPQGGSSRYNLLLKSVYSMFKYLEDKDIMPHIKIGGLMFESIPNYFTGWHTYDNLNELKKALFYPDAPRYGVEGIPEQIRRNAFGTNLDAEAVKQATELADGPFWAIIVSDGAIHNQLEAKRAVSYLVDNGNYVSLVKIGEKEALDEKVKENLLAQLPESQKEEFKAMLDVYGYDDFSAHVRSVGGDVQPVANQDDLPDIMLGQTQEVYSHF
jgi:hypothetical protein